MKTTAIGPNWSKAISCHLPPTPKCESGTALFSFVVLQFFGALGPAHALPPSAMPFLTLSIWRVALFIRQGWGFMSRSCGNHYRPYSSTACIYISLFSVVLTINLSLLTGGLQEPLSSLDQDLCLRHHSIPECLYKNARPMQWSQRYFSHEWIH